MDEFCPSCGEILPVLQKMSQILDVKDEVIADQQIRMRHLNAQISRLRGESDTDRSPVAADAREVFEYWKQQIQPRARAFTGERFEHVVTRLREGHTVADLKMAIDGAKAAPPKHGGITDLRTICRNEPNLLMFISFAERIQGEREQRRDIVPPERLALWQQMLDRPGPLSQLEQLRGWTPDVVRSLGLGLDGKRVVFPVRDADGHLVGLCRYQPNPENRTGSKLIAEGPRELFPPPESVDANTVWLVEGESDAVACRSAGLPAVGVPGVATWKDGWAERFADFERVYICFDCDAEGRKAAELRSAKLGEVTQATIVELDPKRDDGYDIGDLLQEVGTESAGSRLAALTVSRGGSSSVLPFERRHGGRPFDEVCRRLEEMNLKVRNRAPGAAQAQCPVHEDREPSMSVTEGDDGRVLLHCHAGCTTEDIVKALGLELKDLFAA